MHWVHGVVVQGRTWLSHKSAIILGNTRLYQVVTVSSHIFTSALLIRNPQNLLLHKVTILTPLRRSWLHYSYRIIVYNMLNRAKYEIKWREWLNILTIFFSLTLQRAYNDDNNKCVISTRKCIRVNISSGSFISNTFGAISLDEGDGCHFLTLWCL